MFPEFGAPIVEGFSSNVEYEDANDRCLYDKTTERIKCLPCDYDSETSDDEEYDAKKEEEIDNEIIASRNNSSTPPTTQAAPTQSLEDGEEEEVEEEEVEEDEKKKNNKTDESSDEESSGEESSGEESSGEESSVDKKKDEESPSVTEPFFGGNIEHFSNKDVAQKATSMIPTVLFGIPGAPFAAIIIGLFAYLDFELGTVDLAMDDRFFDSMLYGFMLATVLVGALCLLITRYIAKIAHIPYKYYFPLLLGFITLACVQYTGGWEDYAILAVCSIVGILAKNFKFSRPALLFGFILAERVEALTIQMFSLYSFDKLVTRPIFWTIMVIIVLVLLWGLTKRSKLEYA